MNADGGITAMSELKMRFFIIHLKQHTAILADEV